MTSHNLSLSLDLSAQLPRPRLLQEAGPSLLVAPPSLTSRWGERRWPALNVITGELREETYDDTQELGLELGNIWENFILFFFS